MSQQSCTHFFSKQITLQSMRIVVSLFQGRGVMIWAEISATAKTDLVFIDENLNGQRYINEVQTPHVLPFLRKMPVHDPKVQVDNARPHRARIVNNFIHRNNVNRIARPVVSPDLSCIEHGTSLVDQLANLHSNTLRDLAPLSVWRGLTEYRWKYSVYVIGRVVSARLNQNSTQQVLRRFLRKEWADSRLFVDLSIPQRTWFVNAGIIMVDIHSIDFWFTVFVRISIC